MVVVPDDATPFTIPVVDPTEPMVGAVLLHNPPAVTSDKVIVARRATVDGPVIGATTGNAFTVTTAVTIQAFDPVNVTVAVPAVAPYTRPLALIVATVTGAIAHDTPAVRSDKKVTDPASHTVRVPNIGVGIAFTVTANVL